MAKAKTNKTTSPLGICHWLKNCDCLQNVQNLLKHFFKGNVQVILEKLYFIF